MPLAGPRPPGSSLIAHRAVGLRPGPEDLGLDRGDASPFRLRSGGGVQSNGRGRVPQGSRAPNSVPPDSVPGQCGLLRVRGRRIGPLPHRSPANPRGPREDVLRLLLGKVGGIGHFDPGVVAHPSQGFSHLVQVFSESRSVRLVRHGSERASPGGGPNTLRSMGIAGARVRGFRPRRCSIRAPAPANRGRSAGRWSGRSR